MDETVVKITERARRAVLEARSGQPDETNLALWVEVTGVAGDDYEYDLYLMHIDEAAPGDLVERQGELSVVIPRSSVERLRGATVDLVDDGGRRWVLDNPNKPPARPAGPVIPPQRLMQRPGEPPRSPTIERTPPPELSGDVAQRVAQVLEYRVNPAIAAHGGHAELVAVDDGVAYLRLSGGCQGCAMASVTLTQGIKVAITDAVPEVREVVDVTDHEAGDSPYFQPSKK